LNKKNLIIIGAGNVGGFIVYNQDLFPEKYNLLGFLDDDVSKIGKEFYGHPVIGDSNHLFSMSREVVVAIGIASPKVKRALHKKMIGHGFDCPSFISKNAWISRNVQIGSGVIIYPGVSINYETVVEDFVIMNMNCAVGHNCNISKYCALAPGVNLAGFTNIGEAVDIGIGVSTRQNTHIGRDSVIGGQSMLVKYVDPGSKILGVPGRRIEIR
jgi:sugar O-acyltransferase (sialic acid O-acetyltransferase NeuD family)